MKTRTRRTVDKSTEINEKVEVFKKKKPEPRQSVKINEDDFFNTPVDMKKGKVANPFLEEYVPTTLLEETTVTETVNQNDLTNTINSTDKDIIEDVDNFISNYKDDDIDNDFDRELEDLLEESQKPVRQKKQKEKKNLSLNYIGKHVFLLQKSNALDYLLNITPKEFFIFIKDDKLTFNIVLRNQVKTLSEWVVDNPSPYDFKIFMSLETFCTLRTKDLKSFAIINNHKILINNKTPYKIKKYIRLE